MTIYAVLGSTGNCGTALIQNLLKQPKAKINAYCRNKSKLLQLVPEVRDSKQVEGCRAVFLVVSTNDNIPGCHLSQDTAISVINALKSFKESGDAKIPKLVLLSSSATIDDHFSRHLPWLLRQILLRSASHVYNDLKETEKLLRSQEDWLTTIYIKPGALSVDKQRGHALSFTEEGSPLSYMDLAAAMTEAANDEEGQYDLRNVSVVNTNGRAKFPTGTPMCILTGLLRHFLPFLHPYLPTTGP
ncbi:hypothetical protein DID88_008786 [Monilinia fructigena]|uniref:NAD(P)-binding domain-containing protein n=1 Tax=Monilinia fructigena TaxID=38457 RepID=A0A395J8T8_9HELO|nr:hypothetical protein DID88_008786 [Monilinia fructigena]